MARLALKIRMRRRHVLMRFDLVCALRILAILSLSCPMIGKANMILKKKESLHFDLM